MESISESQAFDLLIDELRNQLTSEQLEELTEFVRNGGHIECELYEENGIHYLKLEW